MSDFKTRELPSDVFVLYIDAYHCENKADWIKVFNDLIDRGLKRVMLIVSDDFPGIPKAIETLFPYTDHQLCLVHLQRNVKNQMNKEDLQTFNKELKKHKRKQFRL